jgi:hypothetical protein
VQAKSADKQDSRNGRGEGEKFSGFHDF